MNTASPTKPNDKSQRRPIIPLSKQESRWLWCAIIGLAVGAFACFTAGFLIDRASSPLPNTNPFTMVPKLLGISLILTLACWVGPWRLNDSSLRRKNPARLLRSTRRVFLLPIAWFGFIDVAILFIGPMASDQEDRAAAALLLIISLFAGIAATWIGLIIRRHFDRRFRQAIHDRELCFHCGYDLHGRPDADRCPECGEPVELPTFDSGSV